MSISETVGRSDWQKTRRKPDDKPVTSSTPIKQLVKLFLADKKQTQKLSTYKFYADNLRSFNETCGEIPVAELKKKNVTAWIAQYQNKSDNYRHNLLRAVRACFKWAVEEEHIDHAPQIGKLPPATRREVSREFIDNWDTVIQHAKPGLADLLTLMVESGCRPKEARDCEARHFIDGALEFPVNESKGETDARVIPLNTIATAIVSRLVEKYPTGRLFRNNGRPWTKETLSRAVRDLSKTAGVPFTAYMIRHRFVTKKLEAGFDPIAVAACCGHKSVKMITEIYNHINKRSALVRAVVD
jgi:integrase